MYGIFTVSHTFIIDGDRMICRSIKRNYKPKPTAEPSRPADLPIHVLSVYLFFVLFSPVFSVKQRLFFKLEVMEEISIFNVQSKRILMQLIRKFSKIYSLTSIIFIQFFLQN